MFSFLRHSFVFILFLVIANVFCISQAQASQNFNTISIRFDRMKAGTSPGNVLVTLTTSSAVSTEAKLKLTFDPRYVPGTHFSTTASSFTTSTASLPAGATSLPLTSSTATSVTGQTIVFSINNLTANTTYAFYITGGFLLNPNAGSF